MGAHLREVQGLLIASTIFLLLAVVLGAFGAHALEDALTAAQQETWETANRYQFYHGLGAFFVLILCVFKPSRFFRWAAFLHLAGIVLFSGSLYVLSAGHLLGASFAWLGPVTPVGGLAFTAGWALVLAGLISKTPHV